MSMQGESLEVLEKADLPSAQARAIVHAIEIEIAGAKDVLATKHDIVLLRSEMAQLRTELQGEFRSELGALRGEIQSELGALRGEIQSEFGVFRGEIQSQIGVFRGDTQSEIANLRGELQAQISASASSIIRQMYAAMLGQMAVLLGILYFFATNIVG